MFTNMPQEHVNFNLIVYLINILLYIGYILSSRFLGFEPAAVYSKKKKSYYVVCDGKAFVIVKMMNP